MELSNDEKIKMIENNKNNLERQKFQAQIDLVINAENGDAVKILNERIASFDKALAVLAKMLTEYQGN